MRRISLGERFTSARFAFWSVAGVVALCGAALEVRRLPAVATSSGVFFDDPDDYLRVYRARRMIETGAVRLRFMPEVNYPRGAELHWTAPVDWLLAAGMVVLAPLIKQPDPFAHAAAWMPVAFGIGYTLVMIVFVRRLGGGACGLMAGGLTILSPGFHRAFQLGHPDHQFVLEFLFLVSVSLWARRRAGAASRPSFAVCAASGAAIGLAMWIAPQAMAVWACILIGATFATFHASAEDRNGWRDARRAWSLAALGVVCVGWLFENWPDVGGVAVDKLSLLTVGMMAVSLWVPHGAAMAGRRRRSVALFCVVVTCVAAWVVVDRHRVFEHVSRPEFARWSALVMELQPLAVRAGDGWSPRLVHESLGFAPYALPILLVGFLTSRSVHCQLKVALGLLAVGFVAASILQRRWLDHVNLGLIPVAVIGARELCGRIFAPGHDRRFAVSGFVLIVLAALFWLPARTVLASAPSGPNPHLLRTRAAAVFIRQWNDRNAAPGGRARAILCEDGDGPMLLYLTGLPVVATPYHRALDGLVESALFFAERDPEAARRRLDRLGVGFVVVPYRAHEQLANWERIAFGELRSMEPPDEAGRFGDVIRYKPGAARTMAYRLMMEPDRDAAGLECIRRAREGAATPDGLSGLVYVVRGSGGP